MENLYCTIFIVDISQNPEEVDTVSSRIQQLIEDHGGIIKKVNPWGKQKLAYPIHNRTYGFYVEIEFTANSHLNIPKTIEQEFRINDRVLRYLTYVVTKKELQQREINAGRMKEEKPESKPELDTNSHPENETDKNEVEIKKELKVEDKAETDKVEVDTQEEEESSTVLENGSETGEEQPEISEDKKE